MGQVICRAIRSVDTGKERTIVVDASGGVALDQSYLMEHRNVDMEEALHHLDSSILLHQ